jgi:hypothetical protein
MNNAQKKAREMPPPVLRKIPTTDAMSSKRNSIQSPLERRGSSASDDSHLFFQESKSSNAPVQGVEVTRTEHPVSVPSTALDVAQTWQGANQGQPNRSSEHTSRSGNESDSNLATQTQSAQDPTMPQSAIHRNRLPDPHDFDTFIHLHFGMHGLGTVTVSNFPKFLRATFHRLRQRGMPLHFDQDLVFTAQNFADASSMWPIKTLAIAAVRPMTEAMDNVRGLAEYLERTNCAAIWEHPDPDDTIGFMLYPPTARGWAGRLIGLNVDVSNALLVIEARNRAPMGQRPIPLPRQQMDPPIPAPNYAY